MKLSKEAGTILQPNSAERFDAHTQVGVEIAIALELPYSMEEPL